jgi:hypothetical protein
MAQTPCQTRQHPPLPPPPRWRTPWTFSFCFASASQPRHRRRRCLTPYQHPRTAHGDPAPSSTGTRITTGPSTHNYAPHPTLFENHIQSPRAVRRNRKPASAPGNATPQTVTPHDTHENATHLAAGARHPAALHCCSVSSLGLLSTRTRRWCSRRHGSRRCRRRGHRDSGDGGARVSARCRSRSRSRARSFLSRALLLAEIHVATFVVRHGCVKSAANQVQCRSELHAGREAVLISSTCIQCRFFAQKNVQMSGNGSEGRKLQSANTSSSSRSMPVPSMPNGDPSTASHGVGDDASGATEASLAKPSSRPDTVDTHAGSTGAMVAVTQAREGVG